MGVGGGVGVGLAAAYRFSVRVGVGLAKDRTSPPVKPSARGTASPATPSTSPAFGKRVASAGEALPGPSSGSGAPVVTVACPSGDNAASRSGWCSEPALAHNCSAAWRDSRPATRNSLSKREGSGAVERPFKERAAVTAETQTATAAANRNLVLLINGPLWTPILFAWVCRIPWCSDPSHELYVRQGGAFALARNRYRRFPKIRGLSPRSQRRRPPRALQQGGSAGGPVIRTAFEQRLCLELPCTRLKVYVSYGRPAVRTAPLPRAPLYTHPLTVTGACLPSSSRRANGHRARTTTGFRRSRRALVLL
ncbi:MAG: hypothetical protein KatS3mg077_2670 [Candidatus Binatia bacterium]|nr:MAG: hypothetical protein KatS3mg077_2670 [Candidatus Binatia bacterium]